MVIYSRKDVNLSTNPVFKQETGLGLTGTQGLKETPKDARQAAWRHGLSIRVSLIVLIYISIV